MANQPDDLLHKFKHNNLQCLRYVATQMVAWPIQNGPD